MFAKVYNVYIIILLTLTRYNDNNKKYERINNINPKKMRHHIYDIKQ